MGRGSDEITISPKSRQSKRTGVSFWENNKRDIGKSDLKNILANLGKGLRDIEEKYGAKNKISQSVEERILQIIDEFENIETESPRADELRSELTEIAEKYFQQKLDFSSVRSFEQLFRNLSIGSASKGSMNSKESDRLARMQNILQSQQGELREEALIEIARGNKEIRVAKTEIAGAGIREEDLPGKNKRQIFHRVDADVLKEASLYFYQEIDKGPRDASGFITEKGFSDARKETLKKYKQKMLASAKRNKKTTPQRASYDMILERDAKLSIWEIKTSGHLGNKAGQGEYNRLLENTLLLSLVYSGEVNPYFGCLERDHRFKSSEYLPAGHSLVADNLLRAILPKGLSWEDYMLYNPYTSDRTAEDEVKFAKFLKKASFQARVKSMSEEEKKVRLNSDGTDFRNSFLGE